MNSTFPSKKFVSTIQPKPPQPKKSNNCFDDDDDDDEGDNKNKSKDHKSTTVMSTQPMSFDSMMEEADNKVLKEQFKDEKIDINTLIQNVINTKTNSSSTTSTSMDIDTNNIDSNILQLQKLQQFLPKIENQENTLNSPQNNTHGININDLPDEPDFTDYQNVSIQNIGWAMMFGQGYVPGEGIGVTNKSETAPIDLLAQNNNNNVTFGGNGNFGVTSKNDLKNAGSGSTLASLNNNQGPNDNNNNKNDNNNNNNGKSSTLMKFGSGSSGLGATKEIINAKQAEKDQELRVKRDKELELKNFQKQKIKEMGSANNSKTGSGNNANQTINDGNYQNNNNNTNNQTYPPMQPTMNQSPNSDIKYQADDSRHNDKSSHKYSHDNDSKITANNSYERNRDRDYNTNSHNTNNGNSYSTNEKYEKHIDKSDKNESQPPLDEKYRRSFPSSTSWIREGIQVKITNNKSHYYSCKGIVDRVSERTGEIVILIPNEDSNYRDGLVEERVKSDKDLQTTIPRQLPFESNFENYPRILMVNGHYRGFMGHLIRMNYYNGDSNEYVETVDVKIKVNKNDLMTLTKQSLDDVCLYIGVSPQSSSSSHSSSRRY
jgi:hypothetical protein